jgi:hypothetical protein
MKKIEILSNETNCPVVQMPGRRFPGVVIQGDSLKILLGLSEDIVSFTKDSASEELQGTVAQMNGILSEYVKNYEATMRNCGRTLPYPIE